MGWSTNRTVELLPNAGYDLDMPLRSGESTEVSGVALDVLVHQGIETALYRGRRRGDGAPVAVKVTQSDYPTFRQLARLRREHAILVDLSMPGVPRALDLLPHGRGRMAAVSRS
ncbi:hypothetical protein [Sorangium sp. So ce1078]|uniref:hypothetical protein n=1 Tax=Sorangium sp. So ce1078 TaxID=3133329 RepID=UPI003F5F8532